MILILSLPWEMAKEGFDWPYCEHALTVGYRGSLYGDIQIIGRATRDRKTRRMPNLRTLLHNPMQQMDE